MRKKPALLVGIAIVVTALACNCNAFAQLTASPIQTTTSLPATEQPTDQPSSDDILFQDDFSNEDSGWEIGEYEDGTIGYENGVYLVSSTVEDRMMWGLSSQSFSDVAIEVATTQRSAPPNDNNGYGIGCRMQADDNGYLFRISGDGYYSITKIVAGEFIYLVDWQASNVINQGNASNQLRAVCDGTTLELHVNGQLLASMTDSEYTSGNLTLTATTFEPEATIVAFDDLTVRNP